ncbi:MAG: hypothetical protein JNL90_10570 [Planctomycetes bacterium]|nr:hypothetical protein [Planctomycetota bacterium]
MTAAPPLAPPLSPPLAVRTLVAVTLLAAALRLPGLAALPLAPDEALHAAPLLERWMGSTSATARLLPLALGLLAIPWLASALAARGALTAFALALLLAASPWHLHASRLAHTDSALFLASGLALALLLPRERDRVAPRASGRIAASLAGLAAAAVAVALHAAPPASELPRSWEPLLIGELGLGVLLLALLALMLRAPPSGARPLLCLGAALLAASLGSKPLLRSAAPAAAALLLAAALVLGRLLEATASTRARLALWAMALVPGLPTLISEHLDGGRFELAPLAAALAAERHAGEPLYAHAPEFAARALQVGARPLDELVAPLALAGSPDAAPARLPAAFVLLLLERGAPLAGGTLPHELEARLQLVARTAARRFDLSRYEARLYRVAATR